MGLILFSGELPTLKDIDVNKFRNSTSDINAETVRVYE